MDSRRELVAYAVKLGDHVDIFEDDAQTVPLCSFNTSNPVCPTEQTDAIIANYCLWSLIWIKTLDSPT
jgi:hypothetical protein